MCDDRVIYNATPNYDSDPLNDIALAVSHHNFYGNVLITEPEYLEPEFL